MAKTPGEKGLTRFFGALAHHVIRCAIGYSLRRRPADASDLSPKGKGALRGGAAFGVAPIRLWPRLRHRLAHRAMQPAIAGEDLARVEIQRRPPRLVTPAARLGDDPLSGGRAGFVFFGTKTTGVANAWQKALAPLVHSRVFFKKIPELLSWRLPSYATLLVEQGE